MDEQMSNEDRRKLRLIAEYLGIQFDEGGWPFRRDHDGHIRDFDPLNDNGDAFYVLIELGLNLEEAPGAGYFCAAKHGRALVSVTLNGGDAAEARQIAARLAIFDAGARVITELYKETGLNKPTAPC